MILIIQNDPSVPPGAATDVLKELGVPFSLFHPSDCHRLPDPSALRGAIILGGEMGANDEAEFPHLAEVKDFIRLSEERATPVLGICLGAQLIAESLGGRLVGGKNRERGMKSVSLTPLGCFDPLFESVPYNFVTYQWHDDSFVLPEEAVLLAVGLDCPRQAFRIGPNIYGVQFHPEVRKETAFSWGEKGKDGWIAGEWANFSGEHENSGKKILANFAKIAAGRA